MAGELFMYSLLFISLYFEVFLLVTFLERRFSRSSPLPALPSFYPSVSIVVPCFNEEKTVSATLNSLLSLEYPADKLQVVVVDDGSKDKTLAIAEGFTSDSRVKVFHKENGGKHTAMNLALEHIDSDLIGCLDADSVVASDALLRVVPVFENREVAAVTPGIHTKETKNLLQHMQKVEYRLSLFVRFILASLGSAYITPGPFSTFRTSVVKELGGWRYGHSTEDLELALRIQEKGYLIGNAPRAIVHTMTPKTVKHLFRQRVRWTYGFLRNAVDYRSMIGNRSYGNLGIIILPSAIISIFTALYFFVRLVYFLGLSIWHEYVRLSVTGFLIHPTFNLFYVNTSMMWFLIFAAVVMILILIAAGSLIGTGKSRLPGGTPLFVLFYSFLAPLWLGTALIRAVFKAGVKWR